MDQITLLSLWILGALAGGTLSRLIGFRLLVGFLLAGVVGSQLGFNRLRVPSSLWLTWVLSCCYLPSG